MEKSKFILDKVIHNIKQNPIVNFAPNNLQTSKSDGLIIGLNERLEEIKNGYWKDKSKKED